MLVSFSVANFRSFGEEVTLNMVASNKLTEHPEHLVKIDGTDKSLVRSALLYGANAAGKSNLVSAMKFAQRMIEWRENSLPGAEPFRFSSELASKPSFFEFRFLLNDRIFIYGFDISASCIEAEWLAYVKGDEEPVIFERDRDGNTEVFEETQSDFNDAQLFQTLTPLKQLPIKPNQLFLNRIGSLPDATQGKSLNSILRWLTDELEIIDHPHYACDLLERLDKESEFRDFTVKFLDRIDTGIKSLRFEQLDFEVPDSLKDHFSSLSDAENLGYRMFGCEGDTYVCQSPGQPNKHVARRLVAEHPTGEMKWSLPFCEESDGTQQLLHFLPILATRQNANKVIVIDELDRSLHPLLCWEFIKFFGDSCPGTRKQLIVTTHESHLLNQNLLRRDEYWFVEKDETQQSRLVSLSDFKVRNDLKIQKGYLNGRFGAIPVFGGLSELECLLDCPIKEGCDATEETST